MLLGSARLEASLRVIICETKVLPFDQQSDLPPGDGAAEQPRILDNSPEHLPIIDVGPLIAGTDERCTVAAQIGQACREEGFVYIVGHAVDEGLQEQLEGLSREFFAQDLETKLEIRMALGGGPAWQGYFPLGGELTSGRPDCKEGLYFGAKLAGTGERALIFI